MWRWPLVLGAPNLIYQVVNDFPQSKMAAALAENKGDEARVLFVPFQLLLLGPPLVPIWVAGLRHDVAASRPVRAFAVAYPVICVLLLILAGQPYYTMGLLRRAVRGRLRGAVDGMARAGRRGRRALVARRRRAERRDIGGDRAAAAARKDVLGDTFIPDVNQATRDTVGWPTYVRQVAEVVDGLTPAERAATVIITGNYGEAGAIDRYGPAYGLPAVYSGQNELHNYGPPPESAVHVVFVLQEGDPAVRAVVRSRARAGARLDNGVGVANEENEEAAVYVCRNRLVPWRGAVATGSALRLTMTRPTVSCG